MKRLWERLFATKPARQLDTADILHGVLAVVWLAAVSLGLGLLMRYASRPGDQGRVSPEWPDNDRVERSDVKPTLLVFAHPKCPCTRATLAELQWILERCPNQVSCKVLFYQAESGGKNWAKTAFWHQASSIEGVKVLTDVESRTASKFGVMTSGHALLYDRDGRLMFEGGITPSRGHEGSNPGRSTLLSLIQDPATDSGRSHWLLVKSLDAGIHSTCVFGCSLHALEGTDGFAPASRE